MVGYLKGHVHDDSVRINPHDPTEPHVLTLWCGAARRAEFNRKKRTPIGTLVHSLAGDGLSPSCDQFVSCMKICS
jgi:hypothetical protein